VSCGITIRKRAGDQTKYRTRVVFAMIVRDAAERNHTDQPGEKR
jgi:hypothetical protein